MAGYSKLDDLYSDGRGSKIEAFSKRPSIQENVGMKERRIRDQNMGKLHRDALKRGDYKAVLALEQNGAVQRGIENVGNKNERYRQETGQRNAIGSAIVGGGSGQQGATAWTGPTGPSVPMRDGESMTDWANRVTPSNDGIKRDKDGFVDISGSDTRRGSSNAPQGSGGGQNGHSPLMSFAEKDKLDQAGFAAARQERESGAPAFKSRGQARAEFAKNAKVAIDSQDSAEGQEVMRKKAYEKGAELGLKQEQIFDAIQGESDLSPKAVAARSEARKKVEYEKQYGESDKGFAELMDRQNVKPETREMLMKLSPEDRKKAMGDLAAKESTRDQRLAESNDKDWAARKDVANDWQSAVKNLKEAEAVADVFRKNNDMDYNPQEKVDRENQMKNLDRLSVNMDKGIGDERKRQEERGSSTRNPVKDFFEDRKKTKEEVDNLENEPRYDSKRERFLDSFGEATGDQTVKKIPSPLDLSPFGYDPSKPSSNKSNVVPASATKPVNTGGSDWTSPPKSGAFPNRAAFNKAKAEYEAKNGKEPLKPGYGNSSTPQRAPVRGGYPNKAAYDNAVKNWKASAQTSSVDTSKALKDSETAYNKRSIYERPLGFDPQRGLA